MAGREYGENCPLHDFLPPGKLPSFVRKFCFRMYRIWAENPKFWRMNLGADLKFRPPVISSIGNLQNCLSVNSNFLPHPLSHKSQLFSPTTSSLVCDVTRLGSVASACHTKPPHSAVGSSSVPASSAAASDPWPVGDYLCPFHSRPTEW